MGESCCYQSEYQLAGPDAKRLRENQGCPCNILESDQILAFRLIVTACKDGKIPTSELVFILVSFLLSTERYEFVTQKFF